MSSLIRKGSRSPMSRNSLTSTRRNRAVWDRPATDTRLLLRPRPYPVSLGNTMNPLRMTLKTSAPSRPPSPLRHRAADACRLLPQMISLGHPSHRASGFAADARAPSPRMITHGSHPKRACPTTVDARVLSRMNSRSASLGVEADACVNSQMISRSASLGVEADACVNPQMISHVPARAAEGALATLILSPSVIPAEAGTHPLRPRVTGAVVPSRQRKEPV